MSDIGLDMNGPFLIAAAVLGYLLGSIPFGLLLTRMAGLGDIRDIGSGNIGATNVLRTGNKGLALATLLLMENQIDWINASGGLAWADARTRESSSALYAWAEASDVATPFVADPADRSQVVVTIDFDERVDASAISKALRENGVVDTEPYR